MDKIKYIGLDVHRDTISAAVLNESGRLLQQSVLMTRTVAILDFIGGVRGSLHVTFEEGTHSAWLYDLLSRRVDKLVVCNPRKNALLKSGNKGDAIDARKLADLLRAGLLSPVYHGETSALEVQQLARSYLMLTEDTTRAMGRLKAVFRGQAISCTGRKIIRAQAPRRVSGGTRRLRFEASRRAPLPAIGRLAAAAPRRAARSDRRVPETRGGQVASDGAVSGSAACGGADRSGADAAPIPHQAPVLDLLRTGAGDPRQRRVPRD
jgi:hypothetical protein